MEDRWSNWEAGTEFQNSDLGSSNGFNPMGSYQTDTEGPFRSLSATVGGWERQNSPTRNNQVQFALWMVFSPIIGPFGMRVFSPYIDLRRESIHEEKRYSEEQIAFALRQADSGVAVAEICRKMGVTRRPFIGGRRNSTAWAWPNCGACANWRKKIENSNSS